MPVYDFTCNMGHTTEARMGYGVEAIPCPACGMEAKRESVYYDQCIVTETGMKSGRRNPIPRDEKRFNVSRFKEAASELEYNHNKVEQQQGRNLESPNYYAEGKRQAALVRAGLRPPPTGNA